MITLRFKIISLTAMILFLAACDNDKNSGSNQTQKPKHKAERPQQAIAMTDTKLSRLEILSKTTGNNYAKLIMPPDAPMLEGYSLDSDNEKTNINCFVYQDIRLLRIAVYITRTDNNSRVKIDLPYTNTLDRKNADYQAKQRKIFYVQNTHVSISFSIPHLRIVDNISPQDDSTIVDFDIEAKRLGNRLSGIIKNAEYIYVNQYPLSESLNLGYHDLKIEFSCELVNTTGADIE